MKVKITDYTKDLKGDTELPPLLRSKVYEFAWRYEKGVYQLSKYPTKTFLFNKEDEEKFMNGEEVWIHKDEVAIRIV